MSGWQNACNISIFQYFNRSGWQKARKDGFGFLDAKLIISTTLAKVKDFLKFMLRIFMHLCTYEMDVHSCQSIIIENVLCVFMGSHFSLLFSLKCIKQVSHSISFQFALGDNVLCKVRCVLPFVKDFLILTLRILMH